MKTKTVMSKSETNKTPRGRDPVALISALVGLLALLVSAYTAHAMRQQTRAQVWPYLAVSIEPFRQSIVVANKGTGPAVVRYAQVFVDGKAYKSWDGVLHALDLQPDPKHSASTMLGAVLVPGDSRPVLDMTNKDASEPFFAASHGHLALRLCYCSVLDECWDLDERTQKDWDPPTPVKQCPRVDDRAFTE